jgi:uncharacterized protein (TIGR02118 family)
VYTVTVLYPPPDDPEAFDDYHDRVHVPIAARMNGLVRWTAHRIEQRDGDPPAYHLVVQLSAPTREALQAVLDSPEGRAAAADVPSFATGGAVFLFGEQEDLSARLTPGPEDRQLSADPVPVEVPWSSSSA